MVILDVVDVGCFYFIFLKDRSKFFEIMGYIYLYIYKNNFVFGDDL